MTALMTKLFCCASSGPAVWPRCSPVLVPVLAAEQKLRAHRRPLAQFLGPIGRYLAFACLAWLLGLSLQLQPRRHALVYALPISASPSFGRARPGQARAAIAPCSQPCPAAGVRALPVIRIAAIASASFANSS